MQIWSMALSRAEKFLSWILKVIQEIIPFNPYTSFKSSIIDDKPSFIFTEYASLKYGFHTHKEIVMLILRVT